MLALLTSYDRSRHLERIRVATHSAHVSVKDMSLFDDPCWVDALSDPAQSHEILLPRRAASHVVDSYSHLPERPDMAFMSLWMAINAAYQQIAVRESFKTGKERIKDDYGLDCALAVLVENFELPVGRDGSYKTVAGHFDDLLRLVPEKLLSMMATTFLRSIAAVKHNCSRRYESMSYSGFRANYAAIASAIERTYGEAYSDLCEPHIDIASREINFSIRDGDKANAIIRSLSKKFRDLLGSGAVSFSRQTTGGDEFIELDLEERVRILLRNILYASRNNIAHGKVSSRLNSMTASRDSYSANIFIYVTGYIVLSMLLVNLGQASPVIIRQAIRNLKLIERGKKV